MQIFFFLKIIPIFRIRDGKENLNNNDQTFDLAIKILEAKQSIGIFPEARHNNKRQMLDFKKGIPRIAFLAEEKNNFNLNIKILPVGLYYSKYSRMRSTLHIRFGEPINVSDYQEVYNQNPSKALLLLKDKMEEATRPLIIDIRDADLYDTYESIRSLYVKNLIRKFQFGKLSQINKFKADKITIQALDTYNNDFPDKMLIIRNKVVEYENVKNKFKLTDNSIEKDFLNIFRLSFNTIVALACSIGFIYGLINNALAYFTPKILVLKIKDQQFYSSIKFVWALIFFPIIYAIQIAIFSIFIPNLLYIILYAISLPVFGFIAKVYSEWVLKLIEDWRLIILKKHNRNQYNIIKELHQQLILELDLIVTHWKRKNNITN